MAISFVQSRSALQLVGTSIALAFNSSNSAGNLLVIAVACLATGLTLTCSDSQGNTYSATPIIDDIGVGDFQIFYVGNCGGGANTVTVNGLSSVAAMIALHEFAGVRSTPFDVNASATGSGTAQDSGPATTTVNNELLFGFTAGVPLGTVLTISPGAGFTAAESSTATVPFITQYQIVSSTGTYDATSSCTVSKASSYSWAAEIAAFKQAAAVLTPPTLGTMGAGA